MSVIFFYHFDTTWNNNTNNAQNYRKVKDGIDKYKTSEKNENK